MVDDTKTSCSYCDSQHMRYDYALHRVSNAHVKKVQRSLVHRGFSSVCLVCNFALKSLRQAELHVQEKTHTERVKSFLVDSYLSTDKCTCGSCGITFFNEVVLEAHRLSYSHDSTASSFHTPKLDELSRLLGGLHGQQFIPSCNRLSRICDIKFERVEDSIMHMFTASHISTLRSSSCMVCKKEFTHASDRELHANSSKHQIAVRKCGNLLEEGRTQAGFRKGGYPCMLCMLWCNSWFSLELHLLDKHHAKMTVQSIAKRPTLKSIVFSSFLDERGQTAGCDESTMRSWRHWKGEASEECVWCHRCGVFLVNIDEANKHLDKHGVDRSQETSRLHSSRASCSDSVSESFGCGVCELSFKNSFMLSAHDASFQHHSRLAVLCLTDDVLCCSNCGLLMHNEGDRNGAFASTEVQGSSIQKTRAEASLKCPQLLHHQSSPPDASTKTTNARVLDSVMHDSSSEKGNHQTLVVAADKVNAGDIEASGFLKADKRDNSVKAGMKVGSGESPASLSGKSVRDGECFDRRPIENGLLMNKSFYTACTSKDNNVSSQSGGSWRFPKPRRGRIFTNMVGDGNGTLSRKRFATVPSIVAANEICVGPGKAYPVGTNSVPSEVSLSNVVVNSPPLHGPLQFARAGLCDSVVPQNPVVLAGQISNGVGNKSAKKAKLEDKGVPIVVAATLAPLGTLQESLQSITAIVTESLSSALSIYVEQSTALLKRKRQSGLDDAVDQPDLKRVCSERILEAALRQGLHSVCPNASAFRDLGAQHHGCANNENVRQSIGNDKDIQEPQAVIAVAASIIPNDLEDFSRPAGSQGHAEANKDSCAMRSGDERTQESTDLKSESASQVVVHDQGSAGSSKGKTAGEEKPTERAISCMQPRSSLIYTGIQDKITSAPVYPLAEGAADFTENEISLAAKEPTAAPMGVVASAVSEESESNDDDDYYTFLDPTKDQGKWWSSSDSEDSDSVSK